MKIWKETFTIEELNQSSRRTIHDALGIEFIAFGDDFLEASMPVDHRTHQPFGILHGGASVVLAESLGSIASHLVSRGTSSTCVGIEINASHLKGVREGKVVGRVHPIRLGNSLHVWEIRIRESLDPNSSLVCVCRLSVMVRKQNPVS